ncbi:MAG TPA: FtsX-like permease family protein [Victivallales bacterium]|nr:FtsX-like permease family protein [Victivallales bacterium]HPO90918.1 FtsX-like permease family protein [Victivallales bacterium]
MNDFNSSFFLSLRYLRPKLNTALFINLISIIGVALGVGLLIIVIAVMTGFTDEFKTKLLNTTAHIHIVNPRGEYISNPENIVTTAKSLGYSAASVLVKNALIQQKERLIPKMIIGIDSEKINNVIAVKKYLKYGTADLKSNQILISDLTASEMGLWLGDKLIIHSPVKLTKMVKYDSEKGFVPVENKVYLPSEFEIVGIFSFDKYDFDSAAMFIDLETADELFDMPWGAATAVYVTIPDPMKPEPAQKELIKAIGEQFSVLSWKQINGQFLGVLAVEKTMMYFLLVFVVIVATFSISVSLITFVMRKIREIGLLKALGASDLTVAIVFTLKGFIIGILGIISGTVFGISAITWRNELLFALRKFTGIEIFPRQFYFFSELPATVKINDLVIICFLSIILCIIASLIPSIVASRIQPAKALKYE